MCICVTYLILLIIFMLLYFQLKRMKQIEQERDVLMQGLRAVEQARDWYLKQIVAVQEKMKYLGRVSSLSITFISLQSIMIRLNPIRMAEEML